MLIPRTAKELADGIESCVKDIREAQSESIEAIAVDDLATFVMENWLGIVVALRNAPSTE